MMAIAEEPQVTLLTKNNENQDDDKVGQVLGSSDREPVWAAQLLTLLLRRLRRVLGTIVGKLGLGSTKFFLPLRLPAIKARELVHLTDQYLASGMTFMRRRPLVVTVHDIIPFISETQIGLNLYERPSHRLVYWSLLRNLRKASAVIADSEYTRMSLIRYGGISAEKIFTVHCGVDHARFQPGAVPAAFWERLGIGRGVPVVLHVSNEAPHKNFPRLLRAFSGVVSSFPEAILVKIGKAHSASQREDHVALIGQLGLESSVRFINDVSDDEMVYAYRAARVLALPSLAEGFGLPVLEAMACGTPVVCSDAWSLPEVAGPAALVIDPTEVNDMRRALEKILEDDDLAELLRTKGLQRAAEFTWQRTAQETVRVYDSVLVEHGHAGSGSQGSDTFS